MASELGIDNLGGDEALGQVAGEPGGAAQGVDAGEPALPRAALVSVDALEQGQVAAAEDLGGDPELAGSGPGALHGALRAVRFEAQVLDVDGDPATGVVVAVHGMQREDPRKGHRSDVMAAQHIETVDQRGGEDLSEPVLA